MENDATLFTEQERQVARKRLLDAGFDVFPDADDGSIVFFNNCRNRPHLELFGSGAFYDLNTTDVQAKQATNLSPGQDCVATTTAGDDQVKFTWYSFLVERLLGEQTGDGVEQFRVFFGTEVLAETMPKAEAASDPLYSPFFNVNGHFKQQSVIRARLSGKAATGGNGKCESCCRLAWPLHGRSSSSREGAEEGVRKPVRSLTPRLAQSAQPSFRLLSPTRSNASCRRPDSAELRGVGPSLSHFGTRHLVIT
jgi:hypothetical protein